MADRSASLALPCRTDVEDPSQFPLLMGKAAGSINDVLPAAKIMEDMIDEARACLQAASSFTKSKL